MTTVRTLIFLLAVAGLALPAAAAVPPDAQRLRELRTVIDHPEVAAFFRSHGQLVTRIELVRSGLYRVSSAGCRIDLAVVTTPLPPGMVGSPAFEIRAGERSCQ